MARPVRPSRPFRLRSTLAITLSLALVGALGAAIPVAAFSGDWTPPQRIFEGDGAPNHSMTTDSGGTDIVYVHGGDLR